MHLQNRAKILQLFQRQGKQRKRKVLLNFYVIFVFVIILQREPNRKLGQLAGPSEYDIEKVRKMYDC